MKTWGKVLAVLMSLALGVVYLPPTRAQEGVALTPLTAARLAEFEVYVETALETFGTPGAAVAVVSGGEVVYARGFGVRNPQGDPMTPDTRMLIGSTTKTMTTLLMAQMVDRGVMGWDTRAVDILPSFAVADPALTTALTMQNLVCACAGVPRRDAELYYNSGEQSAEDTIASLASIAVAARLGEAFHYSNQMVSAAGYLTALAAGGHYGTLGTDYTDLVEHLIFAPLGMRRSTFSFEKVQAEDNYAVPYGLHMDLSFRPLPLGMEAYWLEPTRPSSAAWSTVRDLAQYMIMDLNGGVAADGARIVSAENLAHTWEPQVPINETDAYGLGWFVSDFHGLRLLSHGGNTLGFTSRFSFLPQLKLGVVVLSNQRLSYLNDAVEKRLFEMLVGLPDSADRAQRAAQSEFEAYYRALRARGVRMPNADTAAVAVGVYTNAVLGDVTIRRDEHGVLVFDAGEFQTELWFDPAGDSGAPLAVRFVFHGPPLPGSGVLFTRDGLDGYQMLVGCGPNQYTFKRVR